MNKKMFFMLLLAAVALLLSAGCSLGFDEQNNQASTEEGGVLSLARVSSSNPVTGTFRIKEDSSGRYLDAYQNKNNEYNEYRVVTRTKQNDGSQTWILHYVKDVVSIQQRNNYRYLDTSGENVVTVPGVNLEDSLKWFRKYLGHDGVGYLYSFQQMTTEKYLDAHGSAEDYNVVIKPKQYNNTQKWYLFDDEHTVDIFRIMQKSSTRYLDAFNSSSKKYSAVTRNFQDNDSQKWWVHTVGEVVEIEQKSSGRYLDAFLSSYTAVTRAYKNDATQKWILEYDVLNKCYTIRQLKNSRYLSSPDKNTVKTEKTVNYSTQRWVLE